jgi:hypothetical protein
MQEPNIAAAKKARVRRSDSFANTPRMIDYLRQKLAVDTRCPALV